MMRTSPPGRAALGCTASMCGWPLTFFFPSSRSEIPMSSKFLTARGVRLSRQQTEMQHNLHYRQAVKTGSDVIDHHTHAFGEAFEATHRRRLDDIEPSKKYK